VTKAVKAGRVTPGPDGLFDLEEAKREWASKTRQALPPEVGGYEHWRQKKIHYQGLLARLEYEQKLGIWQDKESVDYALNDFATTVRVMFETLADRLAPEVAALRDESELKRAIRREIALVLRDMDAHVARVRKDLASSCA
jgi:hypothetical protein